MLVIGSGPILIGQAAEFDYSGTQACRVLREEGLRVTLINSNPATIMTDPEFADATYIEPITPEYVTKVIAKERPDALLATLGGQTALNAAMALHASGVLEQYGVELIGADVDAIRRGEDRQEFKKIVASIGGGERPQRRLPHDGRGARRGGGPRLPRRRAAQLHDGRQRLGRRARPRPTCTGSPAAGCTPAPPARCCSRSRSSAGRSTSSSSCATATTTWSSSARSRTSTRWACTPATRSPSRRR